MGNSAWHFGILLFGAVIAGAAAGRMAVNDMPQQPIGAPAYPRSAAAGDPVQASDDDAAYAYRASDQDHVQRARQGSGDAAAIDCRDCSDFERGYRWAQWNAIADRGNCGEESWSFRRGCAAYVLERRPYA